MSPKKKSIKPKATSKQSKLPAPQKQEQKSLVKKSLGEVLKSKGLKKLPQRKPNPLPLRPELLLHPNIPKPLHCVNPRTIYGVNWWGREKRKVYKSTEFHCITCGVSKWEARGRQWLEAHEVYEINYQKGVATFKEVVPLCHFCHNFIHSGRLQTLLDQNKLHHSKYVAIITYGDRVLAQAGLEKKSHLEREQEMLQLMSEGKVAPWEKWRLKLDGKLHPPIFKTEREYEKYWRDKNYEDD